MMPSLRMYFPLLVVLCVPAGARAQSADPSPLAGQNPYTKTVPKPTRKPDQVITDDSIALLGVRRVPPTLTPPPLEPVKKEEAAAGKESTKKTAELASLDKQIKDKQKRIALLMRLFVDDEQTFLKDPSNQKVDEAVLERRQYEQDELRWETAELAKLKVKWEELKSSQ